MRVGIIDVGANTVRLLVAEQTAAGPSAVTQQKARLSLGAEIEAKGYLSKGRIEQTTECVRAFSRRARKLGAGRLDVVITSPGRQAANGSELAEVLSAASGTTAQILSAREEGELAYLGATSGMRLRGRTLVCDIGGGSTQLMVGEGESIEWQVSVDIGSLRLSRRYGLARRPSNEKILAARAEVRALFEGIFLPQPRWALVTGGTGRALARICAGELDARALDRAVSHMARLSAAELSNAHAVGRWRAKRLLAGTLILCEVEAMVRVPFLVARGGIREGAALAMLEQVAA